MVTITVQAASATTTTVASVDPAGSTAAFVTYAVAAVDVLVVAAAALTNAATKASFSNCFHSSCLGHY